MYDLSLVALKTVQLYLFISIFSYTMRTRADLRFTEAISVIPIFFTHYTLHLLQKPLQKASKDLFHMGLDEIGHKL